MSNAIEVTFEVTPNPDTYKFCVSKDICSESIEFSESSMASRSPLAQKLFGFPWAEKIFIGSNFVSVTKQDWVEWTVLAEPLSQIIKEHIENGDPILLPEKEASSDTNTEDSDIVKQIKHCIATEIRPALAMDGGDISFSTYENNIVYIYMQGACSGCPSASATLKNGIEVRLKEVVPEIKEVVAL